MKIKEIKEKFIWENFLMNCEEKTFLDSWNWGKFQELMGNKIWRLGVYDKNLIGVALIIKIQAKRGTFLFMPHGPSIENTSLKSKILKVLLKELKSIAKKEKADFIRISPIWERTEENKKIFKDLDFRTGPIHIHPEVTWELDIKKPEDSVLMEMRKTTRYLIRQALKNKDIVIKQGKNLKDLKLLNKVYKETAKRHHFAPFSFDYLRNEFNVFSHDDQIILLLGKYKNEVVSGSMIVFWQDMAFYHQGASLLKYSRIPVSYLMQWEAIKQAQKRKCNLYNFWGIADIEEGFKIQNLKHKKHPWWGLSLFKMGFGGQKKEYVKTQDFPLSKKYWLTFVFEKLRKLKRGV